MPNDIDVSMPSLAEIMERARRRKAEQQYRETPRPDAPQWDDPYMHAAMQQEMARTQMPRSYEPSGPHYAEDVPRSFPASGPHYAEAMPQSYPPSGSMADYQDRERAVMASRTFEPSGPAQPVTARLSPEIIRAKVQSGEMTPEVGRMFLQRMGAM